MQSGVIKETNMSGLSLVSVESEDLTPSHSEVISLVTLGKASHYFDSSSSLLNPLGFSFHL